MGRTPLTRTPAFALCAILLALICVALASAEQQTPAVPAMRENQPNSAPQSAVASPAEIARGRYLVEQVAMCSECHTPRDAYGNLDRAHWLEGATIWIKPVRTTLNWAEWAPRLAGLPSYTDEQAEQILEKGIGPNGAPIRPPMHIYHMNRADSAAIIAYLRSLRNTPAPQTSE